MRVWNLDQDRADRAPRHARGRHRLHLRHARDAPAPRSRAHRPRGQADRRARTRRCARSTSPPARATSPDGEWGHGYYQGPLKVEGIVHDLSDPEVRRTLRDPQRDAVPVRARHRRGRLRHAREHAHRHLPPDRLPHRPTPSRPDPGTRGGVCRSAQTLWSIVAHDVGMGRHTDQNTVTLDRIGSFPLFSTYRRKELVTIASNMTTAAVCQGTELTHQGDRGSQFYVLLSGTVDVIVDGESVRTLDRGDFFGELALLKRQPRRRPWSPTPTYPSWSATRPSSRRCSRSAPSFARSCAEGAGRRG